MPISKETKATRFGYSDGLLELLKENNQIMVLDADLSKSTTTNRIKEAYPDHFVNVGIAEQNMLGIAAGLSLGGYVSYVST